MSKGTVNVRARAGQNSPGRIECLGIYVVTKLWFSYGVSDPELRKKLFGPAWVRQEHEIEKLKWTWWKRLLHRFQHCSICKPEKKESA